MGPSNLTKNALKKMFAEGKRFDGRGLLDLKDFSIEYGVSNKAEGSARVKLGNTEVIVGVKLSMGEPYPDSADSGNLIVSADLLPLASPRFESGPPKFPAIELSRLMDRMLRESGILDMKKYCIKEGEKVWTLFVDIYPLNDDGALLDAASIGCVAALKNAKLPGIDKDGRVDYKNRTDKNIPVEDLSPVSFTFYKLGDSLILHPTREEEEACETKINLGMSKLGKEHMVNSCQKGNETPFTMEELDKMMEILPKKYDEIIKKLEKFLK